jgi:hypothetical protein
MYLEASIVWRNVLFAHETITWLFFSVIRVTYLSSRLIRFIVFLITSNCVLMRRCSHRLSIVYTRLSKRLYIQTIQANKQSRICGIGKWRYFFYFCPIKNKQIQQVKAHDPQSWSRWELWILLFYETRKRDFEEHIDSGKRYFDLFIEFYWTHWHSKKILWSFYRTRLSMYVHYNPLKTHLKQ